MKPKPHIGATYSAISGPHEHPNGEMTVRVMRADVMTPAEVPCFYICEVLNAVSQGGPMPHPGQIIHLHYTSFLQQIAPAQAPEDETNAS